MGVWKEGSVVKSISFPQLTPPRTAVPMDPTCSMGSCVQMAHTQVQKPLKGGHVGKLKITMGLLRAEGDFSGEPLEVPKLCAMLLDRGELALPPLLALMTGAAPCKVTRYLWLE